MLKIINKPISNFEKSIRKFLKLNSNNDTNNEIKKDNTQNNKTYI